MFGYYLKNILKFFQIVAVIIIPLVLGSYLFPDASFLSFMTPIKAHTLKVVSIFTTSTISGGIDLSLVYMILPWIIYIIFAGIIINIIDSLEDKAEDYKNTLEIKKVQKLRAQREEELKKELSFKTLTYLMIDLYFERFTISSLSEAESERKKEEIRQQTLSTVANFGGTVIKNEDIEFENPFANAIIFPSQDEAINFLSKYSNAIPIIDDEIQNIGYSVHYRAIFDSQEPSAKQYDVLEFLEKAIGTAAQNEVLATNYFADRYQSFGKQQQVKFTSKGSYSINKKKVELKQVEF